MEKLARALAEEEVRKADRFYFEEDRDHFIVSRGLLRVLLGLYLKRMPAELRIAFPAHEKPHLIAEAGNDALCFNAAHSSGLAAYALALNRPVGVDIEFIRPNVARTEIAEHFCLNEFASLRDLPDDIQPVAFFNCWTRKEAYLKALGCGLSLPLDHIEVSLVPGEPAKLLHVKGDLEEAARWSLQELAPAPGYTGALAVYGHDWQLTSVEWLDGNICSEV